MENFIFFAVQLTRTLLYTSQVLVIEMFTVNVSKVSNDVLSEAIHHKGSSYQSGHYVPYSFLDSGCANN